MLSVDSLGAVTGGKFSFTVGDPANYLSTLLYFGGDRSGNEF